MIWLELGVSSVPIDSGCAHLAMCILVVWSSLGTLGSVVLSDSESSFLGCFGSTVLGLFDFLVWFVSGVILSRVPVGVESSSVCDSTASAVCVFAREGSVGELGYVSDIPVLWQEVCVTARSGVRVLCCVSSWSFEFGVCSHCCDGNCVP